MIKKGVLDFISTFTLRVLQYLMIKYSNKYLPQQILTLCAQKIGQDKPIHEDTYISVTLLLFQGPSISVLISSMNL